MTGDSSTATRPVFNSHRSGKTTSNARVKITCPECAKEIPLADTNVALCRACEKIFSFAELFDEASDADLDLAKPPRGTWVRELGGGFEIGSTTRSRAAFSLVPFATIWSAITLGGCYGTQIYKRQFDLASSLFGIPFLLGSIFLISSALIAVCGKIIVKGSGEQASISIGVGPVCYTRRFRWSEIKRIHQRLSNYEQNGQYLPVIELQREGKPIRFGRQLTEPRRRVLLAMLRLIHIAKK